MQLSAVMTTCVPLAVETHVPLLFQPEGQTGLSRAFDLLKATKSIGS